MTHHVYFIRSCGTDDSVVDAARVSLAKSAENYSAAQNQGLIRYLAKHGHWTPFAHTMITFRVSVPIAVARQLAKHQVGGVINEVSRRYIRDTPSVYTPPEWRESSESIKQGSAGPITNRFRRTVVSVLFRIGVSTAVATYRALMWLGVCPEQARFALPLASETQFIWSGSLVYFARVWKQRSDPHAQKETRDIADEIDHEIKAYCPRLKHSWLALTGRSEQET